MSVHVAAVAEAVHVKQHGTYIGTVRFTPPSPHTLVSRLIFFDLGAISLDLPRPLFPWKILSSGHLKQAPALARDERHPADDISLTDDGTAALLSVLALLSLLPTQRSLIIQARKLCEVVPTSHDVHGSRELLGLGGMDWTLDRIIEQGEARSRRSIDRTVDGVEGDAATMAQSNWHSR